MEPSFWSWEKGIAPAFTFSRDHRRNGAQLLELGKGRQSMSSTNSTIRRNGAQLLELGKGGSMGISTTMWECRNGAQLLELGKGRPAGN